MFRLNFYWLLECNKRLLEQRNEPIMSFNGELSSVSRNDRIMVSNRERIMFLANLPAAQINVRANLPNACDTIPIREVPNNENNRNIVGEIRCKSSIRNFHTNVSVLLSVLIEDESARIRAVAFDANAQIFFNRIPNVGLIRISN